MKNQPKIGTLQVCDQKGNVTETREGAFTLLPPSNPNVCPECAHDHDPNLPHDATTLYFQYWFYGHHKRWPTWEDAMAHCAEEIKIAWRSALKKLHGIDTTSLNVRGAAKEGQS